jgi:hypothetical protein
VLAHGMPAARADRPQYERGSSGSHVKIVVRDKTSFDSGLQPIYAASRYSPLSVAAHNQELKSMGARTALVAVPRRDGTIDRISTEVS